MQVILQHAGAILGVPGEQGAGIYEVEDGQIVAFSPLPAIEPEQTNDILPVTDSLPQQGAETTLG